MSFTFTVEALHTGAFTAHCQDQDRTFHAGDYQGILAAIVAHKAECDECAAYGIYSEAATDVDGDEVNLSNVNAAMILTRLGYDAQEALSGWFTVPADDFLARVLLAGATGVPDDGIAPTVDRHGRGATFIDCGVRAGYFTETLARLQVLAEQALALGRDVVGS